MLKEILKERGVMPAWDGKTDWNVRKEEIRNLITDIEYGAIPVREKHMSFREVTSFPYACGKAVKKEIEASAHFENGDFTWNFLAFLPNSEKEVPFFLLINGEKGMPSCGLPLEEILDRGFGLLTFNCHEICVDLDLRKHDPKAYDMGVYPFLFPAYREGGQVYSQLSVWAWAASRLLDWAEKELALDMSRSAVVGHSRLGKTALYAGMMDERFSYVIPNDSGCAGAALYRGIAGEKWEDVARNFPYWMGPEYRNYVNRVGEIPFDQHFLIAACAPRKVYVSAASEDAWADPVSMYLSCRAASPVYEMLGLPGLISPDRLPEVGEVMNEGSIGFHLRKGFHDLSREDWNRFMDFMEK